MKYSVTSKVMRQHTQNSQGMFLRQKLLLVNDDADMSAGIQEEGPGDDKRYGIIFAIPQQ